MARHKVGLMRTSPEGWSCPRTLTKLDELTRVTSGRLLICGRMQAIFLTDVPQSEWTEFTAEGVSRAVSGMIFSGERVVPGVPRGGIGAGYLELNGTGCLRVQNCQGVREIRACGKLVGPIVRDCGDHP